MKSRGKAPQKRKRIYMLDVYNHGFSGQSRPTCYIVARPRDQSFEDEFAMYNEYHVKSITFKEGVYTVSKHDGDTKVISDMPVVATWRRF
jgi:hypothetical protein